MVASGAKLKACLNFSGVNDHSEEDEEAANPSETLETYEKEIVGREASVCNPSVC